MPQRVAGLQVAPVGTPIDTSPSPTHIAAATLGSSRAWVSGNGVPYDASSPGWTTSSQRQPAPGPPQVVRAGRDAGHRDRRRADLVRHLLPDEDHLDLHPAAWLLAAQPWHA